MTIQAQTPVPKWLLIVSALFALMEIGYAIGVCLSPEEMLDRVDHSAKGVDYLIYMGASRQFALGCILAYSIIKRSAPMLSLSYIFLLIMFLCDTAIGIQQKENTLIIMGVVMSGISAAMLWAVNRKR